MDWIHCNTCYEQPSRNSNLSFLLTSCGHIFCARCETRDTVDQCQVCKNPCVVTKLTSNMKPEVRSYFEDIEDVVKKLCETVRFQKSHRYSLSKMNRKTLEKYRAAKNHIRQLEAQNAVLKKKLETYDRSRISASPRSAEFHFTPSTNRKTSPYFNSALMKTNTVNSAHSNQSTNPFRVPDLRSYQQYRNVTQRTPVESPVPRTPGNFPGSLGQRTIVSESRRTSNFPLRTPPYTDFRKMNITGQRKN